MCSQLAKHKQTTQSCFTLRTVGCDWKGRRVIGTVFCQKITQIGAWCKMIRFSAFGDALTTLCRDLRPNTCMTPWTRTTQRINIGHMFKKKDLEHSRTSYVSLVIMELELDAKFLETLEDISWARNAPHILNVLWRRLAEKICIPGGR